ncbi:hypothetical protein Nepgr_001476 [Nepenthes gracilis]|uniref:Uncharacterized protein n=1 Tax=Nepenthes gracilis TaxID=150966 RepID=A0AAD3P592_NEPGR|nr:hypothetical protein Nepgr_001476 [Nepenthes gracilis]
MKDISARTVIHSRIEVDGSSENDSAVYPPFEFLDSFSSFHNYRGSSVQILTQGKLSAPRILRIHKVVNYVLEKMVLEKPLENVAADGAFSPALVGVALQNSTTGGDASLRPGLRTWQRLRPSIEILCNNQVLSPDMSLATVGAYIWKKPEDLVLNYRVVQSR